jgi:hypothetical protein
MREHGAWRRYAYDACRCEPCRHAYSTYKRDYRQNNIGPSTHLLRWPVEPLFRAAQADTVLDLAMFTGFTARTIHRWLHNGIPDRNADRAAVALGLHPMTIWPNYCDELEPAA